MADFRQRTCVLYFTFGLGLKVILLIAHAIWLGPDAAAVEVDFDKQIQPLLAEHCYACHGPDEQTRQADLRFDQRTVAIGKLESGNRAIVPGDAAASEMIRRLLSDDPDEVMPPPDFRKQPTPDARLLLQRWVDSGAGYSQHWAFQPISKPRLPKPQDASTASWPRNEIDRFVLARLQRSNLHPSPEADRLTVIRRLSLDLRGLPPSLEELERFASCDYEQVVDAMLSSHHYGERMAQDWLDLARYGDTNGYHNDSERAMWLYRDYVIQSFNDNKPYDRFIIENMAGDLLPDPTDTSRIASGFNRCVTFNEEGGADPDEFYVTYAVDRANTTGQVFLGLTVGCTQCHDHKYDPISQREYYQLYAFFNSVDGELGAGGEKGYHNKPLPPLLQVATAKAKQQLAEINARITAAQNQLELHPESSEVFRELQAELDALQGDRKKLADHLPTTMVMVEMDQRKPAYVLVRGDFQSPGDEVQPGVPSMLPPFPKDKPRNRLGLAYWLTDPQNPLVSRVVVNRIWKQFFGEGIVKTLGDFGTQGERPSHPELLDWLAADFVEHGWDVKRLQKQILLSATYRQSSSSGEQNQHALEIDPTNRLLWRATRFRLSAEEVRDVSLAISGLLNGKIGGPSVKPHQPTGYLSSIGKNWKESSGEDLYRRGMYTFWRRTMLYPTFQVFDAPSREFCTVQRPRTNTPLQALVTLNDPSFVQAARKFGERILAAGGPTDQDRLDFAFKLVASRKPNAAEHELLIETLNEQRAEFTANPVAGKKLVSVLPISQQSEYDVIELAAWTAVGNILLNLDETITRE